MQLLGRRRVLATLSAAAIVPLAGCSPPSDETPTPSPEPPTPAPSSPAPTPTATHPFGLEVPSAVEAVIFDGGFGTGYVREAADALRQLYVGLQVQVLASTQIGTDLAPRFTEGATPPDLIDNSGTDLLAIADLTDQLLPLDSLLAEPNLEGEPVGETLYSGVVEAGTFNGRQVALNYALSVFGLWHSVSHFAAQGWAVPTAWDELLELGRRARELEQYLFVWGDDAAGYYAELAIASAIKEGGHAVRRALDNLEPDGWYHPAVTGVLQAMQQCVDEGYVLHGGPFLAAQSEWSEAQRALLYPSGSWIASEMAGRTAPGFEMTVAPVPSLTAAPTLPPAAIHSQPVEQFIVPRDAANPAGGLELLRIMLSRDVAAGFARAHLMPTVVRGSVPTDLDSTALASQTSLLSAAGEDVFSWRFVAHYGLGVDYERLWAGFLSGQLSAAGLAAELQALSDAVREDPATVKYTVE